MGTTKVAITMDEAILGELDRLVKRQLFPNRSRAIQSAVREKLERMEKGRLARECAKRDVRTEQAMAEEGIDRELSQWPPY
ncbi:MAG: CopG family ribbon-helix-helix protein [Syntrophales bacterium]